MNTHDTIRNMLHGARAVTTMYLDGLSDTELLVRPVAKANHLAWQLGHLLCSEADMINGVMANTSPVLSAEFRAAHGKEGAALDASPNFLTKAEYLDLMSKQREATLKLLSAMGVDDFDKPGPEASRSYAPTVGSIFILIGSHELMHAGQIAVVRRKLEKPIVM